MSLSYASPLTVAELERDVDRIWTELQRDPPPDAPPELLAALTRARSEVLDFRRDRHGLEALTTSIIVSFATSVAANITVALWGAIIKKLRKQHGQNVLQERDDANSRE